MSHIPAVWPTTCQICSKYQGTETRAPVCGLLIEGGGWRGGGYPNQGALRAQFNPCFAHGCVYHYWRRGVYDTHPWFCINPSTDVGYLYLMMSRTTWPDLYWQTDHLALKVAPLLWDKSRLRHLFIDNWHLYRRPSLNLSYSACIAGVRKLSNHTYCSYKQSTNSCDFRKIKLWWNRLKDKNFFQGEGISEF